MAFNIVKSSLQEKLVVGTVEGKDVVKTRTYQSLEPAKTDQLFQDLGILILAVQSYQGTLARTNTVDLEG